MQEPSPYVRIIMTRSRTGILLADRLLRWSLRDRKMAVETRAYVISLLESYHERINQIALLHYELEYPANVS